MASDYQQRDNNGSMFINDEKKTDKHPDFRGRIKIGRDLVERILAGEELQISAWKKKTKKDETYLSLEVKAAWKKGDAAPTPPPEQIVRVDDDAPPF